MLFADEVGEDDNKPSDNDYRYNFACNITKTDGFRVPQSSWFLLLGYYANIVVEKGGKKLGSLQKFKWCLEKILCYYIPLVSI